MARSRAHGDVGDARHPRRRGDRLRVGLGQRRPALRDPDDGGDARVGALYARAEPHPDDGPPAPPVKLLAGARAWTVRPGLSGGGSETPRDSDRGPFIQPRPATTD